MTASAPLKPESGEAGRARLAEQSTSRLRAPSSEVIVDSLPLLDHRARSRTISRQLAPFGHYLALQDGDDLRLMPLESKITHIGRGIAADLRFEDPRVSRNHAIIVLHGRFARLLDNRSVNGTYLNGRSVVATNLRDGDVIRLGPVAMQYVEIR